VNALQQFIQSNPPAQELKRALAVEMTQQGYTYREIQAVLQVSLGCISYCNERYTAAGVEGLKLLYWGTQGYLSVQQKQELFDWLRGRDYWTIEEVMEQIEQQYNVVYQSRQSYYALLKQAGLSWKSSQPTHPHKDDEQVGKKKQKLWSYS